MDGATEVRNIMPNEVFLPGGTRKVIRVQKAWIQRGELQPFIVIVGGKTYHFASVEIFGPSRSGSHKDKDLRTAWIETDSPIIARTNDNHAEPTKGDVELDKRSNSVRPLQDAS